MLLIYDSTCSLCKSLAFKVHLLTSGDVGITALATAEAQATLDEYYPGGWDWDFYVVDKGRPFKGLRGLPRLLPRIGIRNLMGLLKEYGTYKKNPSLCGSHRLVPSRRAALKATVLAPMYLAFAKLPAEAHAAPVLAMSGDSGLLINVAEILNGEARAYECKECVRGSRPPQRSSGTATRTSVEQLSTESLLESSFVVGRTGDAATYGLRRSEFALRGPGQEASSEFLVQASTYSAWLIHPRFDISIGCAQDTRATMGGMIRHDVPSAVLDYVIVRDDQIPFHRFVHGYADGIKALGALHARQGRTALAELYEDIAEGVSRLARSCEEAISEQLFPVNNQLILTSMSELLAFASLPPELAVIADSRADRKRPQSAANSRNVALSGEAVAGGAAGVTSSATQDFDPEFTTNSCGWGCCCGCGMCVGCGCGIGICAPPAPCTCSACPAVCGCGCGYCCGSDLCS